MYRQGDVLLVPTDRPIHYSPVRRSRNQGIVLAEGEATGHHHRVMDRRAREYRSGNQRFLMVARGGATLTHEEHDPISLPSGWYEIVRQREYDPVSRSVWVTD